MKISQNFVAFSENMNFNLFVTSNNQSWMNTGSPQEVRLPRQLSCLDFAKMSATVAVVSIAVIISLLCLPKIYHGDPAKNLSFFQENDFQTSEKTFALLCCCMWNAITFALLSSLGSKLRSISVFLRFAANTTLTWWLF